MTPRSLGHTAGTPNDAIVMFAGVSAKSIAASSAVIVTFSGTD